jgi:hypothetical protein
MTNFFQYMYRVYIPKSGESFSSYAKSDERKYQTYFWVSVLLCLAGFGFHVYALTQCAQNARAGVCYSNLYSWAGYTTMLGFAATIAIVLHYGYNDPEEEEVEFKDIDDLTYEDEDDDNIL